MAVRHEDAEEYELPPLRGSLDEQGLGEDEALDDIDEQIRLLDGDGSGKPRGSTESENETPGRRSFGDDGAAGRYHSEGVEIKGEGSNIEALIARVCPAEGSAT